MFDIVDRLYKIKSGSTENPPSDAPTPPPSGGGGSLPDFGGGGEPSEPAPPAEETLPENKKNDNLNILLENDDIYGDKYIDLSKGKNSLGSMENELSKLLRD